MVRLTDRSDMTISVYHGRKATTQQQQGGRFAIYVRFNNISVISGRWAVDNEKLCTVEPRLRSKRYLLHAGHKPGTATSVGQCLIY